MANRLRVARLAWGRYRPLAVVAPDVARHRRLDALIRRHLPGVTASLLAQPSPSGDGDVIDWYSDLAGQPVALSALPKEAGAEARALLADRLKSIAALAERLAPADPEAAAQLREALSFPGEETVYVVGGQPVITFWGHQPLAAVEPPPPLEPPPAPAAAPVPDPAVSRWRGRGLWLGLALLVLVAAGAALVAFDGLRWPPWGPDFAELLAAAKEEEAGLGRRVAALEAQLKEELARCAAARALIAALADEQRLQAVLADAQSRLTEALALCPLKQQLEGLADEGRALHTKLDQLSGNLGAILSQCRRLKAEADERERKRTMAHTSACVTADGDAPPLDVYFLQDLTGSFFDDLPNMVKMIANLVARAESGAFGPDVRFGLGSFMDKPHPVFGTRNTYVYKNHLNLTRQIAALTAAVRGLRVVSGGDHPEAQYEALIEMVANARSIGFRNEARRFVVLLTDAGPHVAGDWRSGGPFGAPRPSSGKGGVGPLDEDYPSPEQAITALRSAGITPIFLVSGRSITVYQAFVNALGKGVSRPLSPDSANVLDALLEGLKHACKQ
ncbi:MAG: VWA domain-containing protein [Caulobacteraceae bacterium]